MTALAELNEAGDAINLTAELREYDLVKAIPGARWNDRERAWRIPLTWPHAVQLRGVLGAHLEVGPRLNEWLWALRNERIDPAMALRVAHDTNLSGPLADKLYPLQRVAAHFGYLAERVLIGDKPGSGKTYEALATLKLDAAVHGDEAAFPCLIVCPSKVRRSWAKHIPLVFDDAEVILLSKTAAKRRKDFDRLEELRAEGKRVFMIVNWEGVAPVSRLEPFGNITMTDKERQPKEANSVQWGSIVADEAHRMCDRKAKQTRAIKAVAFGTASVGTGPTRFRIAMTGTPVANNSADLWSILNFLDPVAWPAYSKFVERYATTQWNEWGALEIGGVKPETAQELYKALDPVFIARPKEIILPHLVEKPPPEVYYVEMEPKQRKAYESMRDEMLAELDGGHLMATSPLVRASRLNALACAYGEMVDKGRRDEETGDVILDLNLSKPSCKVNAMLEIIEERPEEQIVFFAESRQLISLCQEALEAKKRQYTLLVGGQSDAESEVQESRFERGETRIALCTISAAKEGINSLVTASTLVFLQKSWSMVANLQAEDRIHREGQKAEKISIIEVVTEGTLEDWKQLSLLDKVATLEEVVRDAAMLEAMLKWKG